jgi:hypothetical protein
VTLVGEIDWALIGVSGKTANAAQTMNPRLADVEPPESQPNGLIGTFFIRGL